MNFEMSDDRRMLSDTLRRYLSEAYPFDHRSAVAYEAPFHDRSKWAELAELGVFYALVSEECGGMGGRGFDIVTVFTELGRALCPEPVLGQLLAASLRRGNPNAVEPILDGSARYALAVGEIDDPYEYGTPRTAATHLSSASYALSGRKTVVYGAASANKFLVTASMPDGTLGLFDVDVEDVEVIGYSMIDGGPAGEVVLDGSPGILIVENAGPLLETTLDLGALALCAEALGAMEIVQDMLVDYLRTRTQFGQPIGAFQALQHRAIDLAIEIEQARSIIILAASAENTPDFPKRAAQAKHLVGKVARQVAEEAIQMHGGIGITWEYPLSHYAKRLVMIDHQLGDTDHHLERLTADLMAN